MDASNTDWELLALAASDRASLSRLFAKHRHYVFRIAWGILNEESAADDVVQDVFLKLQSGRLKAKPGAKFTTWLFSVAVNTAREQARKRRWSWGHAEAAEVLALTEDSLVDPARFDRLRDLGRSLAKLPLRQREVVVLRFFEGFDTAETAEILGCREGTVKAHLHRATLKLREELKDPCN